MLGKLLATSKALLLAGFVLLLAPRQGLAYPSELGCSSPMTVGSIIMEFGTGQDLFVFEIFEVSK